MTMNTQQKLDDIDKELRQLYEKRRELMKTNEQRSKIYKDEKTLYQRFFGQPPLSLDPELESVNTQIDSLNEDKKNYFKVLQAAASVPQPEPEKDWSSYPFYSHTLKSWNFNYPVDQLGFYLTSVTGIGLVSKALWKSWNIKKAAEALENNLESLAFHRHFSGLNNEQLKDARRMRQFVKLKGVAAASVLLGSFTVFVQLKNKIRVKK